MKKTPKISIMIFALVLIFGLANTARAYDTTDFTSLVSNWLRTVSGSTADVNVDGKVNTRDLGIMMSNWGSVSPTPTPTDARYFKYVMVNNPDEWFIVKMTNPDTIQQALNDLNGQRSLIVSGIVISGNGGFNSPWSWSLDPSTIVMGEVFMELCDAAPSYIEGHLAEWLGQRLCPWSARVNAVNDALPVPTPTPTPTPTPIPTPITNSPPAGWFDLADSTHAVGWVYDRDQGNNPTNIQILIDGVLKTTITANASRPDLVEAGVAPNAEHGFEYPFSGLSSGTHTIRINTIDYPSGTIAQLPGSPISITVGGTPTPTPTPGGGGWTLDWSDEFDYNGLPDSSKWGYETGFRPQWSDVSYYGYRTWHSDARSENSRVENGNLVIEARADGFNGYNISTACVSSRQTKQFLNGKIEIRAKMNTMVNATDNALWFVGSGSSSWPEEGEIDLLEYTPAAAWGGVSGLTHGNTAFHTLTAGNETQTFNYMPTISTEYHIYSVEWDQSIVRLFYDGVEVSSYPNNGSNHWPFDHSIFLYMNIEPGDWAGGAAVQYLDINRFPVTYYVDYVRYYTQN